MPAAQPLLAAHATGLAQQVKGGVTILAEVTSLIINHEEEL